VVALGALRRSVADIWDEFLFLALSGLAGGLLSLLVVTIPLALAAHYGATLAISEQNVVSLRRWLAYGRQELRFFAKWFLLAFFVGLVLASNILFYLQFEAVWSSLVAALMAGLLLVWVLPQPFAPAFYLRQKSDRRLRTALRNAALLVAADPLSAIIYWLSVALVAVPLALTAWPLLPLVAPPAALVSNRLVKRFVELRMEAGEKQE
jgi:hypothetical protein